MMENLIEDVEVERDETTEETEDKKKPIKSLIDLQRLKIEKLMKNPLKPVIIPEPSKEKDYMQTVPTFVRNVMGSSAGAGSGEFHVYRHLRRKEYARQKCIHSKNMREQLDEAFHLKLEQNRQNSEAKTAKKRAKRLKKKERAKRAKTKSEGDGIKESVTEEEDASDSDENLDEQDNGSGAPTDSEQAELQSATAGSPDTSDCSKPPNEDALQGFDNTAKLPEKSNPDPPENSVTSLLGKRSGVDVDEESRETHSEFSRVEGTIPQEQNSVVASPMKIEQSSSLSSDSPISPKSQVSKEGANILQDQANVGGNSDPHSSQNSHSSTSQDAAASNDFN